MFRRVLPCFAIGSYSLFMMEQKQNPKLQGLKVTERSKLMSKLYKELSPEELDALKKRAAATPSFKREATKPRRTREAKGITTTIEKREPSLYAKFVKENIHKFSMLERGERMKAVAKLWNSQKPQTSSNL